MPEFPTVASGATGEHVTALQVALQSLGLYAGEPDGVFGESTASAVTAFQTEVGLTSDGVADPATWTALEEMGVLTPPEDTFDPGVVIVHFKRDLAPVVVDDALMLETASGMDLSPLNAVLAALGVTDITPVFDLAQEHLDRLREATEDLPLPTDVVSFRFPEGVDVQAVIDQIKALPFVEDAAPQFRYRVTQPLNDPLLGKDDQLFFDPVKNNFLQWYIFRCRADAAWALSTGRTVAVGVIDAGFLADATPANSHEDLRDHLNMGRAFSAGGGTQVNQGSAAAIRHGTACMGIAGAVGNNNTGIAGFAWESELWPLQSMNQASGSGNGIHQAMLQVLFSGPQPRVMSISQGIELRTQAEINANAPEIDCVLDLDPTFRLFVDWADAVNVPVVISAGNGNRQADTDRAGNVFPRSNAICVGATAFDPTTNPRASFSNFGPRVDMCAPGDRITTCGGAGTLQYITFGGTSSATPMVAGAVALCLSANPALTIVEIQGALQSTGTLPTVTPGQEIGRFLDAEAAVSASIVTLGTNHGQSEWRWCASCQGLHFAGGGSAGACPAGGGHVTTGSGNYVMILDVVPGWSQVQWRWCSKCQGLFFIGNGVLGVCPAGADHDPSTSGAYSVPLDAPTGLGQHDWRWCSKCQGLAFGGAAPSVCPAGGAHDHSGSGDYQMFLT